MIRILARILAGSILISSCASPIVLTDSPGEGPVLIVSGVTTFGLKEGEVKVFSCGMTVSPGRVAYRGRFGRQSHAGPCFGPVLVTATDSYGQPGRGCGGVTFMADICQVSASGQFFIWTTQSTGSSIVLLEQDFENLSVSLKGNK